MKKNSNFRAIQAQRFLRYSIRKFSVGVASVAIASGLAVLGGINVQAAEEATATTPATEEVAKANLNNENKDNKPVAEKVENANKANKANLSSAIARLEAAIEKAASNDKTASSIESAKTELANAKALEANETATQADVDKATKELNNKAFVVESMPKATADKNEEKESKENKNQDPRNGQAIPGQGESGFRAGETTNPIIPAPEGPTSNNKLGSGNNPSDGVFESAKEQFGEVDFTNATEKNKEVKKQWSRNTSSQGGETQVLGSVTYNWKEKEISNEINGWKITDANGNAGKVTAIKPEAPTNAAADRPAEFAAKPSKVYDLNGKVTQRDNEVESEGHPLGVNASNQNYANGVNYSGMVGTHDLPKGYYLELGEKGTKISKEYAVNGNSRLMLSAITGGAYGNMGTAGTGERVKITMYDAATGEKISSVRDDHTIGEKYETEHISVPAGDGGNGDGWAEYRAIYEVPQSTTRVRVEIEALDDGTAINNTYLTGTDSKVTDGYFVGAVNLAVGAGSEMTTNVKTNNKEGKFGEDNLYKAKQTGEFEFTVKSVGGVRHYGVAETEIEVPKGVEISDSIKNAKDWVWFGDVPVSPNNISWDETTRKLTIKYNTSKSNNGDVPYIGVGSNDGTRNFRLPFTTADDYKGTATFKVRTYLPNGLRDAEDNEALNTGDVSNDGTKRDKQGNIIPKGKYNEVVNGLRNSDNPDYYYNKTIYIDTIKPLTPTVEPVHTDSINGEKTDKNQPTELLISVPTEKDTNLTDVPREKQDINDNDKNNGTNRVPDTEVDKIKQAIGGLTSMNVTLPNSSTPITLTKKADGWYNGETKVEVRDGKLVVPVPAGTDLTEANDTTNPDKRIKVTVLDKAGNESDPAYANVLNEAPTVAVEKKDLYVYKTKEADKWNNDKVLEKAKPSATDLEDDRDGVDATKPTIAVSDAGNLDTTKVGDYTVKVQSTDSEGKKSTEADVTVHVLDLITVDPTVTTDPTNPSTTAPVSPKTADTPVKEGDENLGKYPAGVTRDDLVKEVTRTIKYLKEEDANKDDATPLYAEKVQKVTYKRTATVNPETGEVTYSDWEVYNEADKLTDVTVDGSKGKFNAVDSPVIENYLLVDEADKTVSEKEAATPKQDGTVIPEVKKVLYKEIGSFSPEYPAGKKPQDAPETIKYPNNPNDPTKLGDFSKVTIPHVEGYVPTYNGVELTPVDPADPSKGYKVPENFDPTDKFGKTPIQYAPGIQKATVNFVSVDAAGKETPLDEKFNITDLSGKAGTQIPEDKIQARIDVLKSMGYTVKENPFDQDQTFDSDSDKNQNFTIKLTPKVSTPSTIYVVDGDPIIPKDVQDAVKTDGNKKTVDETGLPSTKDQAGKELKVPVEVTYGTDDNTRKETVNVPVKVLPLVKPEGLTVLKDTDDNALTEAVKAKANEAVGKLTDLPEGVTVSVKEIKEKPATTENGVQTPAKVVVEYLKDGKVITTKEVEVPVKVVSSSPKPVVLFEGDKPIKAKDSVTPGEGGKVGEPTTLPETAGKAGATDVTVEVPVTYEGIKDPEKVTVPVTVLPLVKGEVTVAKNTTPDKLKELAKGKAEEAVKAKDFTDKLPKDAKVTVGDVTKAIEDKVTANKGTGVTTVEVPVTYTVDGKDYTTTIPVTVNVKGSEVKPVYVVEGDKPTADDVNKAITPDTDGTASPVTDEDINKAIPTTEGKVGSPDVKVSTKVKYPNGEEEVTVPVTVLPKVKPEGVTVPKDTDKETLEKAVIDKVKEAAKNVKGLPEGVTVTVKETPLKTPGTETPGDKDSVTVTVEYKDKDGKVIATKEVTVPVKVTPKETPATDVKVTPIVVEVGTPITKEDVQKHVELPKGAEIVEIGEIPSTTTPGAKPTVSVKVKLPNGEIVTVQVPVIVTPKVTPIVVEVGTPITKEDVIGHIELPKEPGWEIVEVGEIPTTETPGNKTAVKVKVKLPTGEVIVLEVPVTVTPKQSLIPQTEPSPATPAPQVNKVVTRFVDEDGKDITSPEEGLKDPKALEGYVFDKTTTDKNGTVFHHYKKVTAPNQNSVKPTTPGQAEQPATPTKPATPVTPANAQAQASVAKQELPNTGMAEMNVFAPAVLSILGGLGLAATAKKKDEE